MSARADRRQAAPALNQTQHDPRVWGAKYRGRGPVPLAIVMIVVLVFASYLAYTKRLPFADRGFEVTATFENATTLRETSPVRIAGVNVGEVIAVEANGDAADVTMALKDEALPIHEDASAEIRPRLFLEGNFFVDLKPGTPSSDEIAENSTIPVTQTATAVQIDEVLTALQSDVRVNLQGLLEGYGTALTYRPGAADDVGQEPSSKGKTAAEALADSLRFGGPAGRDTAIVNEALQGEKRGDLGDLIEAQRDVFTELDDVESELQGLITAFNTTTGALAAEQDNVSATVRELAPTLEAAQPSLANLDAALPPLRALSLELRPGIAELPDLYVAATPWLDATQALLRDGALGGLAKELRRGAPATAGTTRSGIPLMRQISNLSRCVTDTLDPTFDQAITVDPNVPGANAQPSYLDFLNAAVNSSGESASFDGNGFYLRAQTSGGPQQVSVVNPNPTSPTNQVLFGNTIEAPDGSQPALPAEEPPFRMDVQCFRNGPANLNSASAAAVGPAMPAAVAP